MLKVNTFVRKFDLKGMLKKCKTIWQYIYIGRFAKANARIAIFIKKFAKM
jgi:hypothetical protein